MIMYIKTPNKILAWHFASRIYHTSRHDKIVSLYKSSSNESAFEYINLISGTYKKYGSESASGRCFNSFNPENNKEKYSSYLSILLKVFHGILHTHVICMQ